MRKLIELTISPKESSKYLNGYPLIPKELLPNWDKVSKEGTILNLLDTQKRFVAKGYYGRQNKGYGWILSTQKSQKIDTNFFGLKIKKALSSRADFFDDKSTTAFRVFNGDGDGIGGLTIDYFDGFYLITWYSMGIYSFRDDIIKALQSEVNYKGIYQKKRFDNNGQYLDQSDDFLLGEEASSPMIVLENNVKFAMYLDDGPMVGVFLDQREVRRCIRDRYAKGKTLLNTFSYTGAFSIFGAIGGASKTTSVDLAKRSRPKTQEHFEINGIDVANQEIIVEDVFNYFKYAIKKNKLFDIVVIDPPSFARSKKHTFSVAKDYTKLLQDVIQITQKNGIIVASTNYANLSMEKFKLFIDKAFKAQNNLYEIEEIFTLPKDFQVLEKFKESNYLKVIFIRKK